MRLVKSIEKISAASANQIIGNLRAPHEIPRAGEKIVTTPSPAWRAMQIDYATAVQDAYSFQVGSGLPLGDVLAVTEVEKGTPGLGRRPPRHALSHVERAPPSARPSSSATPSRKTRARRSPRRQQRDRARRTNHRAGNVGRLGGGWHADASPMPTRRWAA